MARQKPPATATAGTTFPAAETVDIAQLVEDLDGMLSRLRQPGRPEAHAARG